jgi:hypothetical protein
MKPRPVVLPDPEPRALPVATAIEALQLVLGLPLPLVVLEGTRPERDEPVADAAEQVAA